MTKKNVFRFAVGTPENPQSWIWRFWTQGDEVYFGARDALNAFKVSLHKSGIWRIAFVEQLSRSDAIADRVILRWNKPTEYPTGWFQSVGILVSSIVPECSFKKSVIQDRRIEWFSPPSNGNKLVFKVLFSNPNLLKDAWRAIALPTDRLVHSYIKTNGEGVWVLLREDGLTEIEILKIRDVMKKMKIHIKPGTKKDYMYSRALLVVSEDKPTATTQPTILDIALGEENLSTDPPPIVQEI